MKKIFVSHILIFISIVNFSQIERGTIIVRKNIISDTLMKYSKILDSVTYKENVSYNSSETSQGSIYNHIIERNDVWLNKNKIYFISKDFISNSDNFTQKLKRKERKNNLHSFKIKYSLKTTDSIKKEFYSIHKTTNIQYSNNDSLIKVDSNFKKEEKTSKSVIHGLNFSTIGLTLYYSTESIYKKDSLFFIFLAKYPQIKWVLNSFKTIYKDKYRIEFNINNLNSKKLTIIKNDSESFTCEYKIKNKHIYIKNPPIAELSKGKFNSKKTSLKFKIHKTKHEFKLIK
jgi:hypothetical protein